jgi:hypothetical protein
MQHPTPVCIRMTRPASAGTVGAAQLAQTQGSAPSIVGRRHPPWREMRQNADFLFHYGRRTAIHQRHRFPLSEIGCRSMQEAS